MTIHTPSDRVLTKKDFNLAITAAVVKGAAVDALYARTAQAIFYTLPTGAGTTSDCKLQDSDTTSDGDFGDVAGATFTQGTTVGGAQLQVMNIDLAKRKRYLRLVHTGVGASAAGQAVGIIQLFSEGRQPVAQSVTPVSV